MADSATQTVTEHGPDILVWEVDWQADSSGNKANVPMSSQTFDRLAKGFHATMCITNPGATAPAANYDITLIDDESFDIFGGELANRHTSTTERAVPKIDTVYGIVPIIGSSLTLTFSNTTNANCNGNVKVIFERYRV